MQIRKEQLNCAEWHCPLRRRLHACNAVRTGPKLSGAVYLLRLIGIARLLVGVIEQSQNGLGAYTRPPIALSVARKSDSIGAKYICFVFKLKNLMMASVGQYLDLVILGTGTVAAWPVLRPFYRAQRLGLLLSPNLPSKYFPLASNRWVNMRYCYMTKVTS